MLVLREIPLDLRLAPMFFRSVALLDTDRGRRLRIDGDVYDLAGWLSLPLSQDEVEVIFDALARAGNVLDALTSARR